MNNTNEPSPGDFHRDNPPEDKGSLGAGIGLAWGIAVVGTSVCMTIATSLVTRFSESVIVLWLLPYVFIIAFAIWSYRKGKTRTGLGLMLGLLSMVAVALLLVAACFGMMSNFHGD
ncbi:hypothetical protein [Dyella acidisoli]|uniref:DUF4190 domain-containing protein n=1 Tax=Dyella acidisoli TaxID=1867834 RepID=A0ABQ5XPJ8_9GAMM|nr:hypothetical protein [Dyella acidisoli]GLQ93667.1 hypothetical protein GCM10007901_26180 [Dyella acidisoli]